MSASSSSSSSDTGDWPTDCVGSFFGFRQQRAGEIRLTVRDDLINRAGLLSGVAAFALVDYAMGSALWMEVDWATERIATTNIAINYVAAARSGEITCRAWVDRRTRSNAALRAEVAGEDGRLIATAIGSYAILQRRRD